LNQSLAKLCAKGLQCLVATNCKLLFHSSGNGTETALTFMTFAQRKSLTNRGQRICAKVRSFVQAAALRLARPAGALIARENLTGAYPVPQNSPCD
ncbi:hypothetical protein, partial [Methylosinus sp. RM1]|uniref:hypothetical protein n=1 Tax=Methylosinus sp. RM1 TaxID=2583817 RepID=UPI001A9C2F33